MRPSALFLARCARSCRFSGHGKDLSAWKVTDTYENVSVLVLVSSTMTMTGSGPHMRVLPDGRLHLSHGPIDLIIQAWGAPGEVAGSYDRAVQIFAGILPALVAELPALRSPLGAELPVLSGPVARRMVAAAAPYRPRFITPMAAVAGAVADHVLEAMTGRHDLARAYVNDGGDIRIHLAPGERLVCGVVTDLAAPRVDGCIELSSDMPVRGIATSGAASKGSGGKSFSFGIADAVTVLSQTAAEADAAATIIANAVDLPGHPEILRQPASEIDPDSDLGDRLVTQSVGMLTAAEIGSALAAAAVEATELHGRGLIYGAVLALRGRYRLVGAVPALSGPGGETALIAGG